MILYSPRTTCLFKQGATETFRLSSTKLFETVGGNMQNVEKSMRATYIPDGFVFKTDAEACYKWIQSNYEDYSVFTEEQLSRLKVFLQQDQAGAEALIVARLTKPGSNYRALFDNGIKPHVFIGLAFPEHWAKEHPYIYEIAKLPITQLKQHPNWKTLDRAIKDSDNNLPATRYYYHYKQTCHCVSEDTEVLTQSGWKQIGEVNEEAIAVWSANKQIKFETPITWNKFNYTGNMLLFNEPELNQLVTPNHRMIFKSNNKIRIEEASIVASMKSLNFPNSGYYVGGTADVTPTQARLIAAIQADANIQTPNQCRFHLSKHRKKVRLKSLAQACGCRLTTTVDFNHLNDDTNFYVLKDATNLLKWFANGKVWGDWLLTWPAVALQALIDELKFWDGAHEKGYLHKREEYCSSIYENIDWMKTICHLCGKQGTIGKPQHGNIRLGINNRQFSRRSHNVLQVPYSGLVYCPTVSTGAFLVRRCGKISVTGNSANYDIKAPTFQMNMLQKSGGKVILSLAQASAYLAGYDTKFPEIKDDFHTLVAKSVERGIIYNLFGYPRIVTGQTRAIREHEMKEWYAFIPQSTVGCITHVAIKKQRQLIEASDLRWNILNNCHDSFLMQCPIKDWQQAARSMQDSMSIELRSPYGELFKMKSECQLGFNWGPAKSCKNQTPSIEEIDKYNLLGLREIKV